MDLTHTRLTTIYNRMHYNGISSMWDCTIVAHTLM